MNPHSKSQWLRITTRLGCAIWFVSSVAQVLPAQDPPSKEQAELVDGLLDLLTEPEPQATPPREMTPRPRGALDGEDLGQPPGNPLQTVRQYMLTAASFLGDGLINQQTQELQNDIVVRLDELIDQLEQDNAAEQTEQQKQQASSAEPEPAESQAESSAAPQPPTLPPENASDQRSDSQPQSQAPQPSPTGTTQKGQAAARSVQLVDPKALQQDVWGQLPEQVRKQMQSRMVERFLPSYRQQIEAYFQALIENAPDSR